MDQNNLLYPQLFQVHSPAPLSAPVTGSAAAHYPKLPVPTNLAQSGDPAATFEPQGRTHAPAAAGAAVFNPVPELREPGTPRMEQAMDAEAGRRQLWHSMLCEPYPIEVRSLLDRRNPSSLAGHLGHLGSRLGTYKTTARAAAMRGDQHALLEDNVRIEKEVMRLQTAASLITSSDWPASAKVNALAQVYDTLRYADVSLAHLELFGDTFLHLASRSPTTGQPLAHLLNFFLDAGVDPNKCDASGCPPSHLLKNKADCLPGLFVLLMRDAHPNARDGFDYTLAHVLAAHPQNLDALHACELAGADLRALTTRGETLLHMLLAQRDDDDGVAYLLSRGISADARDHFDHTAADFAVSRRNQASRQV